MDPVGVYAWEIGGDGLVAGTVVNDKEQLARTNQAELFARDGFDRRRVFFQTADLVAQASVLLALRSQGGRYLSVLTTGPKGLEEAFVADQRVHDEDHRDEGKNVIEDPVP
jgi:hypothetical protein